MYTKKTARGRYIGVGDTPTGELVSGSVGPSMSPSIWDKIKAAAASALATQTGMVPVMPVVVPQTGMSTTTKIALGGAAVLAVVLIMKRK